MTEAKKKPFDIEEVIARLRTAVRPFAKAALFELAEDGFNSPFEQLVACLISIRTRDEVTIPAARKLFARAHTAQEISQLSVKELDQLIRASTFHERKAQQIHQLAARVAAEYKGDLPCEPDALLSFGGVGPKCANLVLGIACAEARIGVDIHVHRVTNRWGYVNARTPEKTLAALEEKLPQQFWTELNSLLVPFGKHVCTGTLPRCSECPVLVYCQQIGVEAHR